MQSLLIKDTTRAQREEIVRRALAACGGSCEGCNGCGNSGGSRQFLIGFFIVQNRPPQPIFRLKHLKRGELLIQTAHNLQILRIQVTLRQSPSHHAHGIGRPAIGASPVKS